MYYNWTNQALPALDSYAIPLLTVGENFVMYYWCSHTINAIIMLFYNLSKGHERITHTMKSSAVIRFVNIGKIAAKYIGSFSRWWASEVLVSKNIVFLTHFVLVFFDVKISDKRNDDCFSIFLFESVTVWIIFEIITFMDVIINRTFDH